MVRTHVLGALRSRQSLSRAVIQTKTLTRTLTMAPGMKKLAEWFPWVEQPAILSAPMLYVSNGRLAAEVSKAGGLGIIPGGYDFSAGTNAQLAQVDAFLADARKTLTATAADAPLPVGVGFITAHHSVAHFAATAVPLLQRHRVAGPVWLFAPDPAQGSAAVLHGLVGAVHDAGLRVVVQIGTVAAAREALEAGADVLVAQGADAGGHQFARLAGVVSLVPEVADLVAAEGRSGEVALVAAGGIVDGRGVAAALALGADGVVMGTRFMVAPESSAPDYRRKAILETEDGGITTVKSTFHDDIQGTTLWPAMYDGRAVVTKAYEDHEAGMSMQENMKAFKEAKEKGDGTRLVTWSGTGVGLVRDAKPAGEIVREVRAAAVQRVKELQSFF